MDQEIGKTAGEIWRALNAHGELTLTKLQKALGVSAPLMHWGIGWLARENKIELMEEKRSFRLRLKEPPRMAAAS